MTPMSEPAPDLDALLDAFWLAAYRLGEEDHRRGKRGTDAEYTDAVDTARAALTRAHRLLREEAETRVATIFQTCAFLASAVKSGEEWTPWCEEMMQKARAARAAASSPPAAPAEPLCEHCGNPTAAHPMRWETPTLGALTCAAPPTTPET